MLHLRLLSCNRTAPSPRDVKPQMWCQESCASTEPAYPKLAKPLTIRPCTQTPLSSQAPDAKPQTLNINFHCLFHYPFASQSIVVAIFCYIILIYPLYIPKPSASQALRLCMKPLIMAASLAVDSALGVAASVNKVGGGGSLNPKP